ncbi:hypothetical protein B0I35DRAFT_185449 [Stachybotrys elegans]|uniref:Uncharacterized protein n=1 Tax=Stachybotrys elegans TaxID=80388 RepID=A0A8K0WSQ3_9HYPO|nr:hypothetical protein B0I35DRAFT_185449 [Stachybotrys elegans]
MCIVLVRRQIGAGRVRREGRKNARKPPLVDLSGAGSIYQWPSYTLARLAAQCSRLGRENERSLPRRTCRSKTSGLKNAHTGGAQEETAPSSISLCVCAVCLLFFFLRRSTGDHADKSWTGKPGVEGKQEEEEANPSRKKRVASQFRGGLFPGIPPVGRDGSCDGQRSRGWEGLWRQRIESMDGGSFSPRGRAVDLALLGDPLAVGPEVDSTHSPKSG